MAFFGGESDEVKKLKKQLGAQDVKIGALEHDNKTYADQLAELQAANVNLQTKYDSEVSRATTAEEALAKARVDLSRQGLQVTNLQQALDRAHAKESQDAKGRRWEDQQRDRAADIQMTQDFEEKKQLEEKVRVLEARIKDKDDEIRHLGGTQQSITKRGGRGFDPATRLIAVENELTALKAENQRLQTVAGSSSASSSPVPSRGLTSSKSMYFEGSSSSPGPRQKNTRRPRSSSVSGPSSASESLAAVRLQTQVAALQGDLDQALSEREALEARASKAERETLKASNEAIANQRSGEKVANELREVIQELKEDLDWKRSECESLVQEKEECELRLREALEQMQAAVSMNEGVSNRAGDASTPSSDSLKDVTEALEQSKTDVATMHERCEQLETAIASLQAQLTEASSAATSAHDDRDDVHSVETADVTVTATSSSAIGGLPNLQDAASLEEARNALAQTTAERDALKQEVIDLEDEIDRLQRQQSDHTQATQADEIAAMSDASGLAALVKRCNLLEGQCKALQTRIDELQAETVQTQEEKQEVMARLEAIQQKLDAAQETIKQADEDATTVKEGALELEELKSQVTQMQKELSDKEAALEQADALSEEDARHLRMKEAEMKQSTSEMLRLRQQLKETKLQMDVLHASAFSDEGVIEEKLALLRKELEARDAHDAEVSQTMKKREDELEAGKKQLKRIAGYLSKQGAFAGPHSATMSTPRRPLLPKALNGAASTPISKILKQQHFFASPGGRALQRGMEEDLLDYIELLRDAIESKEQQREFRDIERDAKFRADSAQLEARATEVAEMQSKLGEAQALSSELEALREVDDDKQIRLDQRQAEVDSLQRQLENSEARLKDLEASHESDATEHAQALDRQRVLASGLESEIITLRSQLEFAQTELATLQTELATSRGDSAETAGLHQQQLEAFKAAADQAEARYSALFEMQEQISAKQELLHELESSQSAVSAAQILLVHAQTIALHHDHALHDGQEADKAIASLGADTEVALDQCREWIVAADSRPTVVLAATSANPEVAIRSALEEDTVSSARIQELQGRILRREEQIGSLQIKLQSLTTRLGMAEEDCEELLEEKMELEQQVGDLQRRLDAFDAASPEAVVSTTADATDLSDQLSERQDTILKLQQLLDEKEQDLNDLHTSHALLTAQLEKLSDEAQHTTQPPADAEQDRAAFAQLQQQIDALNIEVNTLSVEKELAVKTLGSAEESLSLARLETEQLSQRLEALTTEKATLQSQLSLAQSSSIQVEADGAKIAELESQINDLESSLQSTRQSHEEAQKRWNSDMEAAVAKAQVAEQLQTSLDSAARDLKASDSQAKELSKQLEAREKQLTELQGRCSYAERRAHAGESVAKEDREQAKATITDLQQRLQIIDAELADRSDALRAAEAAISQRDEDIKSRNEDYWNLKEEVAELQEQAERSRAVAHSIEALEEQLQTAEDEIHRLQGVQQQVEAAQTAVAQMSERVEQAEKESMLKSSELSDLQSELKRRKAAHRFNEEEIQSLKASLHSTESGMQQVKSELMRAEKDLELAHRRQNELEGELATARRQASTASQSNGSSAAGAADDLLEEVSYLNTRVAELEAELGAKADEIEEADTRILSGLKDNKKLSTKLKNLQKQFDSLQSSINSDASPVAVPTKDAVATAHAAAAAAAPKTPSAIAASAVSSSSSSRKRPLPEQETISSQNPTETQARPVYLPASPERPLKSIGRAGPSPSPRKGGGLQDRSNINRASAAPPTAATTAADVVKILSSPGKKSPSKPAVAAAAAGVVQHKRQLGTTAGGASGGVGAGAGGGLAAMLAARRKAMPTT